jgi:hydrogenase nickel incorporation protein HypA/HybF
MHELSLASSVVEYLQRLAGEQGMAKICEIHLEIGDMAHVEPRQLRYSLAMVSRGTVAEGAKIRIRRRRVTLKCQKCGSVSGFKLMDSFADFELKCPRCKSPDVEIDKGRELMLTRVKGSK